MYTLTEEHRDHFRKYGYCVLKGFLSQQENIRCSHAFNLLASGELPVEGKDRGIHTPGLLNVTAFSLYHKLESIGDGVLSEINDRAQQITRSLYGEDGKLAEEFERDYEQLLRKLPGQPGATFPPHQDMHYWPKSSSSSSSPFDTRTTTVSIAVNDADESRGCLWVLPGSHKTRSLYPGCVTKKADSRQDGGGVIELHLLEEDIPKRVFLPLSAGDATIHDEWLVHGSEGNQSESHSRDTLILAYRTREMIAFERKLGFRHSYNDGEDVLRNVRETIFP
jgi:hypothetical protein